MNRYKLRDLLRGVIRLTHLNQKVRGKVAGMSIPDNERTKPPPEYGRNPDISRLSCSRNVGIPYVFSGGVDIQSRPTLRKAELHRGYGKREKAKASW